MNRSIANAQGAIESYSSALETRHSRKGEKRSLIAKITNSVPSVECLFTQCAEPCREISLSDRLLSSTACTQRSDNSYHHCRTSQTISSYNISLLFDCIQQVAGRNSICSSSISSCPCVLARAILSSICTRMFFLANTKPLAPYRSLSELLSLVYYSHSYHSKRT